MTVHELTEALRAFADARDWEQFHSPKNLSMALSIEAAERMEHFQWLTPDESRDVTAMKNDGIREKIGDILLYLLRIADQLDIDPLEAAAAKLQKNAETYPVEKARGSARKYTEF